MVKENKDLLKKVEEFEMIAESLNKSKNPHPTFTYIISKDNTLNNDKVWTNEVLYDCLKLFQRVMALVAEASIVPSRELFCMFCNIDTTTYYTVFKENYVEVYGLIEDYLIESTMSIGGPSARFRASVAGKHGFEQVLQKEQTSIYSVSQEKSIEEIIEKMKTRIGVKEE